MKTLTTILIILISATTAIASPWLACDPYPTTEIQPHYFYLVIDAGAPIKCTHTVDPQAWKIYDLANIPVGNHSSTLTACINDPQWGEACSAPTPFDFARPQGPKGPTGIKLLK